MFTTAYDYGISINYTPYRDGSALRLSNGMEIINGNLEKSKCEGEDKEKINS